MRCINLKILPLFLRIVEAVCHTINDPGDCTGEAE